MLDATTGYDQQYQPTVLGLVDTCYMQDVLTGQNFTIKTSGLLYPTGKSVGELFFFFNFFF